VRSAFQGLFLFGAICMYSSCCGQREAGNEDVGKDGTAGDRVADSRAKQKDIVCAEDQGQQPEQPVQQATAAKAVAYVAQVRQQKQSDS